MAFNLQRYMTGGVVRVVTDALRATAATPKEAAYMRSFARAAASRYSFFPVALNAAE